MIPIVQNDLESFDDIEKIAPCLQPTLESMCEMFHTFLVGDKSFQTSFSIYFPVSTSFSRKYLIQ